MYEANERFYDLNEMLSIDIVTKNDKTTIEWCNKKSKSVGICIIWQQYIIRIT